MLRNLKKAIDLMEVRMEGRLDIEELAKAAYMSPFHFQRMFHMLTGMTVAEYARKRKLTLAAQELAAASAKVVDVALKYGYDSPEAFAKAFRKIHGIAPSEARAPGSRLKAFPRISFHLSLKGDKDMDYRIEEKDAFEIAGVSLRTTCEDGQNLREISAFWGQSHADGTVEKLEKLTEDGITLGVCLHQNPPSSEFDYMIACIADDEAKAKEQGFEIRSVPAATWAIFTIIGPMPGAIQEGFNRIFSEWFPATGYEHAGGPEFELYTPSDASADDYRSEIWIPILKK
ncbi:GyrI-like domain-containing protein [Paenibacillus sp. SCIV0701]|uniref:GyrI-like domain-containing protein n=2 Tax=Paenibacillus soyae TaxID=2969249 RepID=A0A9X2SC40_9BACL|nr:GyrI-like domain-containing protein [Paenibacillus soyae]MCR2807665.1 GyrI-like domain-containing protein [Paenibacillus soyae]